MDGAGREGPSCAGSACAGSSRVGSGHSDPEELHRLAKGG
jgi:hypothetical protein